MFQREMKMAGILVLYIVTLEESFGAACTVRLSLGAAENLGGSRGFYLTSAR